MKALWITKKNGHSHVIINPGIYDDYLEFVNNRRLDPGKQKRLYAEAMKWMQEILRNEETADRVMGALKGAAVLKGRVRS